MNEPHELKWNDEIQADNWQPNIVLPEGDYQFEVIDYEKTRSKGENGKISCNMAKVQLEFDGGDLGTTTIYDNILLRSDLEWKISSFFNSIGQKKRGERIVMNWDKARHAKGWAHLGIDTWINDKGNEVKKNKIKYYIDYNEERICPKGIREIKDDKSQLPFEQKNQDKFSQSDEQEKLNFDDEDNKLPF